jgi:hypothetical protein
MMRNHQDSGFRSIVAIMSFGALIFIVVIVSLYTLWGQQTEEDTYFSSQENLVFQEILAVKNIRRQAAEEFINAVLSCIHHKLQGESLTEAQVNERVMMATKNFNRTKDGEQEYTCENNHAHWTFEPPCALKLDKLAYGMRPGVNLGDLTICNDTIAKGIFLAVDHCRETRNLVQCLDNSLIESPDLKKEIDKPVDIQLISR